MSQFAKVMIPEHVQQVMEWRYGADYMHPNPEYARPEGGRGRHPGVFAKTPGDEALLDRLEERQAAVWMRQVLAAVAALHEKRLVRPSLPASPSPPPW